MLYVVSHITYKNNFYAEYPFFQWKYGDLVENALVERDQNFNENIVNDDNHAPPVFIDRDEFSDNEQIR